MNVKPDTPQPGRAPEGPPTRPNPRLRVARTGGLVAALVAMIPIALAQSAGGASQANTGSTTGCATLAQAAANGITAAVAANNQIIQPPQSVTQLSCLGNFFNGTGLNVITNFLNPGNLVQDVEGKICGAATQAYQSAMGTAQCGLTVTGFNLGGFGDLGFGNFCPSLSLGGGGPTWGTIGTSLNGNGQSNLYVNGNAITPSGYPSAGAAP